MGQPFLLTPPPDLKDTKPLQESQQFQELFCSTAALRAMRIPTVNGLQGTEEAVEEVPAEIAQGLPLPQIDVVAVFGHPHSNGIVVAVFPDGQRRSLMVGDEVGGWRIVDFTTKGVRFRLGSETVVVALHDAADRRWTFDE